MNGAFARPVTPRVWFKPKLGYTGMCQYAYIVNCASYTVVHALNIGVTV